MQIYKITNLINSKIYIGKDTTDNELYYGSGKLIKRSIKKYGIENFKKEIIEECSDYQLLSEREIYWIEYYNSNNLKIGYNISKGGDGGDTISNNPNKDNIINNISKVRSGKTYEEMFGLEKANQYKENLSISNTTRYRKGKNFEQIYGVDKSNEIKDKLRRFSSRSLIEKLNNDQEKYLVMISEMKSRVYDTLLTDSAKEKSAIGRRKYHDKTKKEKDLKLIEDLTNIKSLITEDFNNFYKNYNFLIRIYKNVHFNFLKNVNNFHLFFDGMLIEEFNKMEFENRRNANIGRKHNQDTKNKIKEIRLSKSREYINSIVDIIDKNNIKDLEDYFSKDESDSIRKRILNSKIRKEIDSKYIDIIKKKRIPIKLSDESLYSMKLKLGNKVEIDGITYISVSEASKLLGIDRGTIRYRLKSFKYKNYIYI